MPSPYVITSVLDLVVVIGPCLLQAPRTRARFGLPHHHRPDASLEHGLRVNSDRVIDDVLREVGELVDEGILDIREVLVTLDLVYETSHSVHVELRALVLDAKPRILVHVLLNYLAGCCYHPLIKSEDPRQDIVQVYLVNSHVRRVLDKDLAQILADTSREKRSRAIGCIASLDLLVKVYALLVRVNSLLKSLFDLVVSYLCHYSIPVSLLIRPSSMKPLPFSNAWLSLRTPSPIAESI